MEGSLVHTLALLAGLAACGDSGAGGASASGTTTGITSVTGMPVTDATPTTGEASASMTGSSSEPAGTDGATGDTNDGPKLDVGVDETGDSGGLATGCRKVDFLFVIDNSGLMSDEQQHLISSFPGFISTIEEQLEEAKDYHIMVVDTDAYVFGGCEFICPLSFNLCPGAGQDYECGVTKPEVCEDVIGAGVIDPKGDQSSSKACSFSSGARYIDVSEPDLTGAFSCAAQVGTGSTDDPEKPMQAMVAAVAPSGKSAACNLGFLRPDAILVVTFITDEDDDSGDGSLGTPEGWKASLVAAKKGDPTALAVLGLFGDGDQPNAICPPFDENNSSGAEPSPRLRQFVTSFGERGVAGSVCSNSYDAFFEQAVAIIDTTCDGFVPPPM